jgi:endoglucanase
MQRLVVRAGSFTSRCAAKSVVVCALAASGCAADAGAGVDTREAQTSSTEASEAIACAPSRALGPNTRFFTPPPLDGATQQILGLVKAKQFHDAALVGALVATPQAVWFKDGTPSDIERSVRKTMSLAALAGRVPVLVAYNLPFRDCGQYSGGGALDTAAYEAWIDAFAKGIGKGKAVVILEPDGLGLIPYNTTIYGQAEWCQPTVTDAGGNTVPAPGASPSDRYTQLNYAVDALEAKAPSAAVYLDGSHSDWLGVGEAAYRLDKAGVARAQGFFLNVSNYQPTPELEQFGTWVSDCITAATAGADWAKGHFDWCPSQYNAALNYTADYSAEYAATVTAGLANMMNGAAATTHFVLDTGRNGQGAWQPDPATYPDAQTWCNAPKRGAGLRPSPDTGYPLADAVLWVKIPGGSDGACNRGIAGGTTDPEWGGTADPVAGAWFPAQALELATLASPKLF